MQIWRSFLQPNPWRPAVHIRKGLKQLRLWNRGFRPTNHSNYTNSQWKLHLCPTSRSSATSKNWIEAHHLRESAEVLSFLILTNSFLSKHFEPHYYNTWYTLLIVFKWRFLDPPALVRDVSISWNCTPKVQADGCKRLMVAAWSTNMACMLHANVATPPHSSKITKHQKYWKMSLWYILKFIKQHARCSLLQFVASF